MSDYTLTTFREFEKQVEERGDDALVIALWLRVRALDAELNETNAALRAENEKLRQRLADFDAVNMREVLGDE